MNHPELADALQAAQAAHANGRLTDAESIYRTILARSPRHAGALHGLALLAAQAGDLHRAESLLRDAVAQEPGRPDRAYQLGLVQLQLRNLPAATASLRRVLELDNQFPDAHNTLGVALKQQGDVEAAIACYRQALALNPSFPEAASNLGVALRELGRIDQAIDAFNTALAARPHYPEALSNLGDALRAVNRTAEAVQALRRAAQLRPDAPEIQYNLGIALQEGGQADEAAGAYQRALALRPDYADALNNLGNVWHEKGDLEAAVDAYRRAATLRPGVAQIHNNLGRALKDLGRLDDAIDAYRRAISLQADLLDAQSNLGNALVAAGDTDAAIVAYRQALTPPNRTGSSNVPDRELDARWNYALALLLRGDFEQGWRLYEVRNRKNAAMFRPDLVARLWDGSDLQGRRILLLGEQGLGDTVHFVRYAQIVASRGAWVILHCQPALRPLLQCQAGIKQVVAEGEPLPPFDVCCPLMSLPYYFKTRAETIPNQVPYLTPPPNRVEHWARRLAASSTGLRVGLVWAGNPGYGNDRNRSTSLASMSPLASAPGVTFVSLQKGARASEAQSPPPGMRLIDFTDDLTDLTETAALVANLDLVISVDTAVAHLGGAMGKPVWTLLPFAPDWRWQLGRSDSPWYPTMRLFRQPVRGDWGAVMREAEQSLKQIAPAAPPRP